MSAEEVFNSCGNSNCKSQNLDDLSFTSTCTNEKFRSGQFNTVVKGKFTVINGNTLVRSAYEWTKK